MILPDDLCQCEHPAREHHTSIGRSGQAFYGECLHYGANETGGCRPARPDSTACDEAEMYERVERPDGDYDLRVKSGYHWVDHCFGFTPREPTYA